MKQPLHLITQKKIEQKIFIIRGKNTYRIHYPT